MSTAIKIRHTSKSFNSYRAARVKSLFNAEDSSFSLDAQLDIDGDWNIGVVVGPSGSGRTSIGRAIFPGVPITDISGGWHNDRPIIDDIAPGGDFNEVTGSLSAVGLGSVPAWLRPYHVLSNGEQFRAGLARLVVEKPEQIIIDEFTSVIDRQIARVGSSAFQKSWRRGNPKGKAVLLTPHYDVLDWLEPDWIFDTKEQTFERAAPGGGYLRRRPRIELEIFQTDSSYWRFFKPHYYLDLNMPIAAQYFVGTIEGELVTHLAVAPHFHMGYYRATRLVVMPEWQGAGVGTRFLDAVCEMHLKGKGRGGREYRTLFHTSHPQLVGALRRSRAWRLVSQQMYGASKVKSARSIAKSNGNTVVAGFGGHFRAVQGFKYVGDAK